MKKSPIIIGLTGHKMSGKTTIAQKLNRMFRGEVQVIGFSDPIYRMLEAFGLDMYDIMDQGCRMLPHAQLHGKTVREAMVALGHVWGRQCINENVWIDKAEEQIDTSKTMVIFENIRYQNELEMVRRNGGIIVAVVGGVYEDTPSENEIDDLMKQADIYTFVDHGNLNNVANELLDKIEELIG